MARSTTTDSVNPTDPVQPEGGRGSTLVRARYPYSYDNPDTDTPNITSVGVLLTQEQAKAVIAEAEERDASKGVLYIDTEETG